MKQEIKVGDELWWLCKSYGYDIEKVTVTDVFETSFNAFGEETGNDYNLLIDDEEIFFSEKEALQKKIELIQETIKEWKDVLQKTKGELEAVQGDLPKIGTKLWRVGGSYRNFEVAKVEIVEYDHDTQYLTIEDQNYNRFDCNIDEIDHWIFLSEDEALQKSRQLINEEIARWTAILSERNSSNVEQ